MWNIYTAVERGLNSSNISKLDFDFCEDKNHWIINTIKIGKYEFVPEKNIYIE
jgi:hypothetical protein